MPATGVYFVSPRWIAAIAAALTLSGVSKSGSPTERLMISRPWALSSRAFCVTAMVADGLTRASVSAMKAMGRSVCSEAAHHRQRPCQPQRLKAAVGRAAGARANPSDASEASCDESSSP